MSYQLLAQDVWKQLLERAFLLWPSRNARARNDWADGWEL